MPDTASLLLRRVLRVADIDVAGLKHLNFDFKFRECLIVSLYYNEAEAA